MIDMFRELLLNLPVSINNLADPSILRDSTAAKLDTLVEDGHKGPVGLITKVICLTSGGRNVCALG